ncbi:MAG TPA: hypothetical protein VJM33_02835 [Microthrixaceae bacterium]|nr:hypothetical protein [Microthrixaceae bacterium]
MHANVARFLDAARALSLQLEVVHFEETTRTAADAPIGVPG